LRLARWLAWLTVVLPVCVVCSPWATDRATLGLFDWDVEEAHRYLVSLSVGRFHEMPYWNPYACGGFPAWGYIEGGTTVVSPWLFSYLALPMGLALRLEGFGMAVLGSVGAYAMAARFTRSAPARALPAALWAVNSRWALQASVGHTWHFAYALLPWCFVFYESARVRERTRSFAPLFGLAMTLAMMVYSGGIYPLPHAALALGIYAMALVIAERSPRALFPLVASGALAIGLSAPKLFPMLATFKRSPRILDSTESVDLDALLTLLTSREQGLHAKPVALTYGWHENGMYIGVVGVVVLLGAVLLVWGRRESALKLAGVLFVILGLGAFHPAAPWPLLHAHGPFFGSLHVPTRFLYPAVLLLSVVAATGIGRLLARWPHLELVAGMLTLALALDIAWVARTPMTEAFVLDPPGPIIPDPVFHSERQPRTREVPGRLSKSQYVAMVKNHGVIDCYGTPPFEPHGARSVTGLLYHGEAYVDGRSDGARITEWSPNHAVITLSGAVAGDTVVYNTNYDGGWRSDAGPVIDHDGTVATRLTEPRASVTFTYRAPYFGLGVAACLLCLAGSAAWLVRERARADGTRRGNGERGWWANAHAAEPRRASAKRLRPSLWYRSSISLPLKPAFTSTGQRSRLS